MKNKILLLMLALFFLSCLFKDKESKFQMNNYNMGVTIPAGSEVEFIKYSKINRNDIVVFKKINDNGLNCLRVVGMPGEEIKIIKGKLYINNKIYINENFSQLYTVYSKTKTDFNQLKQYNFKPYSENYGMVYILKKDFDEIKKLKLVDSIYELGFDSGYVYPGIIKTDRSSYFNLYYFGPIVVPKIGDTIIQENKDLLKSSISGFSKNIVISDEFFFCVGDNFSNAMDSRVIGLISKSQIQGIVSKVKKATEIKIEVK